MTDHDVSADLDRLRRWEDLGGTWRVVSRREGVLVLSLCRCDGGEEVDRLASRAHDLAAHVGARDASDE